MMKHIEMVAGVLSLVLVTVGCASSERMLRMSGDVFDEYAPPSTERIQSEKYRTIFEKQQEKNQADKHSFSLWPLYYGSDDYTSTLWPLIDNDPYGFAIRPFYNHEGDDHSILFPLSSWNTESKSGWALISSWDRDSFTLLPLAFIGRDFRVILPLWFQVFEKDGDKTIKDATLFLPLYIGAKDYSYARCEYDSGTAYYPQGDNVNIVLLGYYGNDFYKDLSEFDRVFGESGTDRVRQEYLTKVFGASVVKLPETVEEKEALRKKVFQQIDTEKVVSYGFFPLFSRSAGPTGSSTSTLLGLLHSYYRDRVHDTIDSRVLFGLLYSYTQEGSHSERFVFPGWYEEHDGENSTTSFLWRLWRRTKKDGKTGGYILFIPYGDDVG